MADAQAAATQQAGANVVAEAIAPAVEQAKQQTIADFLNTGSTTPAYNYLSGAYSLDAKNISDFITGIAPMPEAVSEAASKPAETQSASLAVAANLLGEAAKIPPVAGNAPRILQKNAEAAASIAQAQINRAQANSDQVDSLFAQILPAQQAVTVKLSEKAQRQNAIIDAALGPQYQKTLETATQNVVNLSAEKQAAEAAYKKDLQSGNFLSAIWHSAISNNRTNEIKQASADANALYGTVQNAISTIVLRGNNEFDAGLSDAQSNLSNIQDQLKYLKEKGSIDQALMLSAREAVDTANKYAQGLIDGEQYQQAQKKFQLDLARSHQSLIEGNLNIKGAALRNTIAGQEIARNAYTFKALQESDAAMNGMARMAGFKNGSELTAALKVMPEPRVKAFTDMLAQQFTVGSPHMDMKKYLDSLPPGDRQAASAQLVSMSKNPADAVGIRLLNNASDQAAVIVNRELASNAPTKDKTLSSFKAAYDAARGNKQQQALVKQQMIDSLSTNMLGNTDFRAQHSKELGFAQFPLLPQDKEASSRLDPAMRTIIPHVKNLGDPVAASAEMQVALRAAGITDESKIVKLVANTFDVYNKYLFKKFNPSTYGFTPPNTYMVKSSAIPSIGMFSGTSYGEGEYNLADPLAQSKIYNGIVRQNPAVAEQLRKERYKAVLNTSSTLGLIGK